MRIELSIAGDVQLNRELLRIGDRVEDFTPAFQKILLDLAQIEREQFDSEGQRASGGWAPLAASTLASKRANGLDERILRATGDLYKSLTVATDGGDAVRRAGPDEMVFGTKIPYSRYHQTGTSRMPRRRPTELAERDRRDVPKVLQRFAMTGGL